MSFLIPFYQGVFPSEDFEEDERKPLIEDQNDPEQDILQELAARDSMEFHMFQGPKKQYIQFILPN
ncbi:hypothetical protein Plec18167_001552 [Paecilomyces lecythidis]|uniref:Uncharacterized protein n=1 Tax=Paecilomyces lecythidis TaxID=3004212 RepID=A0ABR3Y9C7_9EURO